MPSYAEVVQLADHTGTKRKAHAQARAYLAKVAPRGDVLETLGAYALCILADPKMPTEGKGLELASILERVADL